MGLFSKLFGQPAVNVPRILAAVAENGGKGIVQVPYDVFASYMRANGTEHQSGGGAMECYLNLDGKRHKIVIDQGLFSGLQQGQTLVTVKAGAGFFGSTDEQIATALKTALSSFVSTFDGAYAVARQIFSMAESDYLHDCWGNGDMNVTVDSLRPPLIIKFADLGYKESESDIDWHQFNGFMNDALIEVEDPLRKLRISYAITEKIIREWELAS